MSLPAAIGARAQWLKQSGTAQGIDPLPKRVQGVMGSDGGLESGKLQSTLYNLGGSQAGGR